MNIHLWLVSDSQIWTLLRSSHLLLEFLHRLVRKLRSCLGLFQLARQVLDVLLVRLLPLVRLLLCHLPIIIFQAFVLAERDNCLEWWLVWLRKTSNDHVKKITACPLAGGSRLLNIVFVFNLERLQVVRHHPQLLLQLHDMCLSWIQKSENKTIRG